MKYIVEGAIVQYVCDSLGITESEKKHEVWQQVNKWIECKQYKRPRTLEEWAMLVFWSCFGTLAIVAGSLATIKYLL